MKVPNKKQRYFFPFLIFLFSCFLFLRSPELSEEIEVKRVIDGDTIVLVDDTVVRLIGIDTPESVHPNKEKNSEYGKIASDWMSDYLIGKCVQLEYGVQKTDKYGRTLAYAYLNGEMVEETLLKKGYAKRIVIFPNIRHSIRFLILEDRAMNEGIGFWNDSQF